MAIPISSGVAHVLTDSIKIKYDIVTGNLLKQVKKRFERAEQTIICFDTFYNLGLQENIVINRENQALCNFSSKIHN